MLGTQQVNAACDPAECGTRDTGTCQEMDWGPPEYQCLAKCCVIPAGGGGGGSPTPPPGPGYEYHSCPAGTARRDLWRKSQICATAGDKIPLFGRKFAMLKRLTLMVLLALPTACAPAAPENRPTGTPENRATPMPWLSISLLSGGAGSQLRDSRAGARLGSPGLVAQISDVAPRLVIKFPCSGENLPC